MRSLGIFAAPGKERASALASQLKSLAERAGWEVRVQLEHEPPRRGPRSGDGCLVSDEVAACDVLVTLSGDGGVLAAARAATKFNTPVLAVDLGRLGFLSAVRPEELESAFARLRQGEFVVEERMMLEARVMRSTDAKSELNPDDLAPIGASFLSPESAFECVGGGIALNDAVVAKSALARILRLSILVEGELVASIRADGLIISTPTGSTAYALSAGGPIVPPDVPMLLVCPICAHSLNQRPFIVGSEEKLEIHAEWEGDEVETGALDSMLTLDGQTGVVLRPGDIVRVQKSECVARLLRAPEGSFYARLREKMKWGA